MLYVPVTDNYYKLPITYIPVYSTSINESSNSRINHDLSKVQRELADIREELNDLRLEKSTGRIYSSNSRSIKFDEDCSICYPRTRIRSREENYSRSSSPTHYCSICNDYVTDRTYPRPLSPRPYERVTMKKHDFEEDKLPEYLSRQLDLQRLHHRYTPEGRPGWTAYKHDYPYRRWDTRDSNFSES